MLFLYLVVQKEGVNTYQVYLSNMKLSGGYLT